MLIAAVGYAIGPLLIKHRMDGLDARAMMGGSLAICSLLLAPAVVIDHPSHAPTIGAIASVVVLGIVCTALAFVVFTTLVREAGTSRATVITYVNPVVAVALGVALLGERPGAGAVAGLLLILAGSWLSTGRPGCARSESVRPLVRRAGSRNRERVRQRAPALPCRAEVSRAGPALTDL